VTRFVRQHALYRRQESESIAIRGTDAESFLRTRHAGLIYEIRNHCIVGHLIQGRRFSDSVGRDKVVNDQVQMGDLQPYQSTKQLRDYRPII